MSNHTLTRLTQLHAKTGAVLEFAQRPQDEESHTLRNAAIGVGGGLAATYGVGSYLRGRSAMKGLSGGVDNSPAGFLNSIKSGHRMNVTAARGALGRGVAGAKSGAAQGVDALNQGKTAAISGFGKAKSGLAALYPKMRAKLGLRAK